MLFRDSNYWQDMLRRAASPLEMVMWERTRRSAEPAAHCGWRSLWLGCCVACMGIAFGCPSVGAQEAPQTAAAEAPPQTATADKAPQEPQAAETEREVSWRMLPRNFLQDQKDIWLFPVQLGKGRHWVPTIAVTGVTAALITADAHDTPYFRRTQRFEGFNDVFSGRNTSLGMAIVPAAFLVMVHFPHTSYPEHTAPLSA